MAEGIPSDRRLPIKMANSLQQAELISSDLKKASEARRTLREAGWGGFAARLLAIILDLPFILGVVDSRTQKGPVRTVLRVSKRVPPQLTDFG